MFKKLRRKFILVAMLSIIAVLVAIMVGVNTANYVGIRGRQSAIMDVLVENGGQFPKRSMMQPDKGSWKHGGQRILSPEAPYEARFFTVQLDAEQNVIGIDTNKIAAITVEDAIQYATELDTKKQQKGYYGDYMYRAVPTSYGTLYIFLDCGRALETFYQFLWASVSISLAGVLIVFILVLFFSKLVLRPVAESYEKQKQFITDASHEIKTPLTIIDANNELIAMESGESPWTESIRHQVQRLTAMTDNLVFLSRMDEENSRLDMVDFSLSDAVEEIAKPFLAIAETQEKALKLDIQPGISFRGNETSIRYLVSSLLDNAMKYSNEHGVISLQLRLNGSKAELTVCNTVDEIEQGDLSCLFERFYRRDASHNSSTGGSGIGLSAARATVLAHKGRISARSVDGKSVEFKAEL